MMVLAIDAHTFGHPYEELTLSRPSKLALDIHTVQCHKERDCQFASLGWRNENRHRDSAFVTAHRFTSRSVALRTTPVGIECEASSLQYHYLRHVHVIAA
jgi:hypothetical protein